MTVDQIKVPDWFGPGLPPQTSDTEGDNARIHRHLEARFQRRPPSVYTYVGNILIAVNPHESLDIYTKVCSRPRDA